MEGVISSIPYIIPHDYNLNNNFSLATFKSWRTEIYSMTFAVVLRELCTGPGMSAMGGFFC